MLKRKETIETLAAQELEHSVELQGHFHSTYEAYAILKEEIEDATQDIESLTNTLQIIWQRVKDDFVSQKDMDFLRAHAFTGVTNLIQVIAMCDKFKHLLEAPVEKSNANT